MCKFIYSFRNIVGICKLIYNCIYTNRSIFQLINLIIKFSYYLFFLVISNILNNSNSSDTQLKTESCTLQLKFLLNLKQVRPVLNSISYNSSKKLSFVLIIIIFQLLLGYVLILIE